MKSFDYYKNTFFTTAERGLSDYRVETEGKINLFQKAVSPETGRSERLVTIFKLIREFLPKDKSTDKIIEKFFQDPNTLPFNIERLSFEGKIGRGSQCEAYLLTSREEGLPSYVIKVQKSVKPQMQASSLTETAKNLKNEYQSIREMYQELAGIVPKEFSIILENPSRFIKEPRIAFIQRFYGGSIRDFFKEMSIDEILALCRSDEQFFASLKKFIDITLKIYREKGIVVDFFGPKNLSIIIGKTDTKLVLLDPHIIYSDDDKESWERVEADKTINYLITLQ